VETGIEMLGRALFSAQLWYITAIILIVTSQVIRLQQTDPAAWIFWDYAGRLGGLAVLAISPGLRKLAFAREPLRVSVLEAAIWILFIVLVDHYFCGWLRRTLNAALPATVLGLYPQAHGWLHTFDDVAGIGLVAYSEEVIFRRCALRILRPYFGEGGLMITMSSLLFGVYHWWTGIGNIAEAVLIGALLMFFYRRSMALWPVVLAHYLTDIIDFAF
jgi:uncharacterized protein